MNLFSVHNLTAGYGNQQVLDAISFSIDEGEFVGMIGPNGSGKSTLIKLLAGNMAGTSGKVEFRGRVLTRYKRGALAREFSVVHQFPGNVLPFTVYDFIMMGRFPHRSLREYRTVEDRDAVARAIDLTGISSIQQRRITELSGGEVRLVTIACALAQNDRVVILDEPVANLDIKHAMLIMDILHDLNRAGSTVIIVLHDINLAAGYCGRILGLKNGRLFLDDSTERAITYKNIELLYDTLCITGTDPVSKKPHVYPVPGYVVRK